jgi:4-amino-4-deoxy-L-arabinose transferase-like glycosyltransferase
MKPKDFIYLGIILLLGLILRLYNITAPLADLHSWRQADTAAVSRNFVRSDFNLLMPKYDDLSSIQSGLENPNGLRFVEFPIYNAIIAALYKIMPFIPIEIYGRIVSIFFSLVLISVIYYLVLKEKDRFTAIIASLIYSVFPFFVFFSRTVLPETTALSFSYLAILFLYLNLNIKDKKIEVFYIVLSSIAFSAGILIKPTVIFFFIPIIYLFFKKYGFSLYKKFNFYICLFISIVPFILWRKYISNYPEAVPSSLWLISQVNTSQGLQNIFFRPAFFRWVFYERINNIIMGGFASFFLILGILGKQKNNFFNSILFSSIVYLFVFQGGNVQHEYYQILILPSLVIFSALGVNHIKKYSKQFIFPFFSILFILMIFVFSFFISLNTVKNYYNYSEDLVSISKIIKDLTQPNDKIITDTTGDTTLLYLSDRKGSPAVYKDLGLFKNKGYSYFVTFNKELTKQIVRETDFNIIFENDKFSIFKL